MIYSSSLQTHNCRDDESSAAAMNNNDQYGDILASDKCPICLMIFPKNLSSSDRTKHAEEHAKQDRDTGYAGESKYF